MFSFVLGGMPASFLSSFLCAHIVPEYLPKVAMLPNPHRKSFRRRSRACKGIFAGHDFVYQGGMPCASRQDWAVNFDGTRDPLGRAVRGAVVEFARKRGLLVSQSYLAQPWPSWAILKPTNASS
eukprot:6203426-Pleurochrysis_carterae.AAC.1